MSKVLSSPATFVGGSLAGALLLAAYLSATTPEPQPAPPAPQRAAAERVAVQEQPAPAAQPAVATAAIPAASSCPTQPVLGARGERDGHFALDAALQSGAGIAPAAFLSAARDAAREGRLRDAETALLAACHAGERSGGAHSVALADTKTQVGQEYVTLAARGGTSAERQELLQRAATLLTESAVAYSAVLGRDAAKTRMAEQRLASLHDPATLRLAGAGADSGAPTSVLGAARGSVETVDSGSRGPCSGSAARRLVCGDAELSQLERDIERLRAQAVSVTRDPSGLRRRDSQALARRDAACEDKACLLRWYAQRRRQLLDEF